MQCRHLGAGGGAGGFSRSQPQSAAQDPAGPVHPKPDVGDVTPGPQAQQKHFPSSVRKTQKQETPAPSSEEPRENRSHCEALGHEGTVWGGAAEGGRDAPLQPVLSALLFTKKSSSGPPCIFSGTTSS